MNIFVTVGTTSFDSLIQAIDTGPFAEKVLMQIADGDYKPLNAKWFDFQADLQELINSADLVVCHAGAGSIYKLLEAGIVPLVVPNTERRDKHQLEIARWLKRKNYAVVAMGPSEINDVLATYLDCKETCVPMSEQRFFYQEQLNRMVSVQMGFTS